MPSFSDRQWDEKKIDNIEFCDTSQHNQLFSRLIVVDYQMGDADAKHMF